MQRHFFPKDFSDGRTLLFELLDGTVLRSLPPLGFGHVDHHGARDVMLSHKNLIHHLPSTAREALRHIGNDFIDDPALSC